MRIARAAFGCGLLLTACSVHCQQILWQFTNEVAQASFNPGSPAVGDDGTIYMSFSSDLTNGRGLCAITPAGTKRWAFTTQSSPTTSPSIGAKGTIYFGTFGGSIFAVNPDGTLAWEYQTGAEHVRGVALGQDGTVYCTVRRYLDGSPSYKAKLCAINPDGSKKWEFIAPGEAYGQPTINLDGTVYGPAYDRFYAVNPDGSKYWEFPLGQGETAIGADGTIYANGEAPNTLNAIHPDGIAMWTLSFTGARMVLGVDGVIYAASGRVYTFSPQGFSLWTASVPNASAAVLSADRTLYVPSQRALFALTTYGGIKWELTLPTEVFSSPALLPDGTLYVSGDKRLYAIKVPNGLATSPWPMGGHDLKRTGRAELVEVRPSLSSIRLARGRGFQFTMVGEIGVTYRIDTSPDLGIWAPWTNYVASTLVTHFTDAGATNLDRRFYRAVLP